MQKWLLLRVLSAEYSPTPAAKSWGSAPTKLRNYLNRIAQSLCPTQS